MPSLRGKCWGLAELCPGYKWGLWRPTDLGSNSGSSTWPWPTYTTSLSPSFYLRRIGIPPSLGGHGGSVTYTCTTLTGAQTTANTQQNFTGWWVGGCERQQSCFILCSPTGPWTSKGPACDLMLCCRYTGILYNFWSRGSTFLFVTAPCKSWCWCCWAATWGPAEALQESLPSDKVIRQTSMTPHPGTLAMTPHLEQSQRWKYLY